MKLRKKYILAIFAGTQIMFVLIHIRQQANISQYRYQKQTQQAILKKLCAAYDQLIQKKYTFSGHEKIQKYVTTEHNMHKLSLTQFKRLVS